MLNWRFLKGTILQLHFLSIIQNLFFFFSLPSPFELFDWITADTPSIWKGARNPPSCSSWASAQEGESRHGYLRYQCSGKRAEEKAGVPQTCFGLHYKSEDRCKISDSSMFI